MLYVVIGITILIVSFIIALFSLVLEQKKVEERTSDEDVESGLAASGGEGESLGAEHGEPTADAVGGDIVTQSRQPSPAVPSSGDINPPFEQNSTGGDTAILAAHEDVWWNKISSNGAVVDSKSGDSDEEKSINAIRQELAKLTGNKIGVGADVLDEPEPVNNGPSRIDAKARNLLAGEFSLGDIKKRD